MATCNNCRATLPNHAKFCGACGTPTVNSNTCNNCNAPLREGAQFCGACGQSVRPKRAAPRPQASTAPKPSPQKKAGGGRSCLTSIVILLVIGLGGVVVESLLQGNIPAIITEITDSLTTIPPTRTPTATRIIITNTPSSGFVSDPVVTPDVTVGETFIHSVYNVIDYDDAGVEYIGFQPQFEVSRADSASVYVSAYIYHSDGTPMTATSDATYDVQGQLATWGTADVTFEPGTIWYEGEYTLWLPTSYLATGTGHYALIVIQDVESGQQLDQLESPPFDYSP